MIEERATVVEVGPGRALVETSRSGSCGSCGARHACGGLGGGREARVWADDPVGVAPGEEVVIAVPEGTVLRAGFWAYLLPVVALLVGAVLGNAWGPALGLSRDAGAAAVGLAALAAAFLVARLVGGRSAAAPRVVGRV